LSTRLIVHKNCEQVRLRSTHVEPWSYLCDLDELIAYLVSPCTPFPRLKGFIGFLGLLRAKVWVPTESPPLPVLPPCRNFSRVAVRFTLNLHRRCLPTSRPGYAGGASDPDWCPAWAGAVSGLTGARGTLSPSRPARWFPALPLPGGPRFRLTSGRTSPDRCRAWDLRWCSKMQGRRRSEDGDHPHWPTERCPARCWRPERQLGVHERARHVYDRVHRTALGQS